MAYERANYKAANDPEHWRLRAEESRTLAEAFVSAAARDQMMTTAACYDRLAELAEKSQLQEETGDC